MPPTQPRNEFAPSPARSQLHFARRGWPRAGPTRQTPPPCETEFRSALAIDVRNTLSNLATPHYPARAGYG